MPRRPKAFLPNISEFKIRPAVFAAFAAVWVGFTGPQPAAAERDAGANPALQVKQESKPVFDPDFIDRQPKRDLFYDRIREKNIEFFRELQAGRREKIMELRDKDLTPEELQERILKVNQKHENKRNKFIQKQKKKINKHLQKKGQP